MNKEQKNLLIGILEKTKKDLDMHEMMEFGDDLNELLDFANALDVDKDFDDGGIN
jgi:hypothetical protein